MLHVYLDNEFDAVRMHGKFMQQVIAIGVVLCDEQFRLMDTFYALIRPAGFQRLSPHVRRITHLKDVDIRKSEIFPIVMDRLFEWLHFYDEDFNVKFYSFGPDDSRTLCANAAFYHHDSEHRFQEIIDLQTLLSSRVTWKGEVFQKTHSLESLKQIYRVNGEVNHNALSDARDLYYIHQAYRQDVRLDEKKIEELYETMRKKQIEGTMKRRQHQLQYCQAYVQGQIGKTMSFSCFGMEHWEEVKVQLLQLISDLHLPWVRSLRAREMPADLQACYMVNNSYLCCWLRFSYLEEKYSYRIPCNYHNIESIQHFLRQWFV